MKIFLSYTTKYYIAAQSLYEALQAHRVDLDIYFAPKRNAAGARWLPKLGDEISQSDAMIVVLGSQVGPWQELEYYECLRQWRKRGRPFIIPIIIADDVPGLHFLNQFHCLYADESAIASQVTGVSDALSGMSGPDVAPPWQVTNPYSGLNAMATHEAAFFFGREALCGAILETIETRPNEVLMLVGSSGVGKSSVAQAGVIAALRSRLWPGELDHPWPTSLEDSASWLTIEFVPGEQPLIALARSFTDLWIESPAKSRMEADDWIELFRRGKADLHDLVAVTFEKLAYRDSETPRHVFIYIDQGEELYARALGEHAQLFSHIVAQAALRDEITVMMSIRSDWYGLLQADQSLFEASNRIDVPPLTRAQIQDVIKKPAERLGARFDNPAIVPMIVEATAKEPGSMPMLSYLMEDAWKTMQSDEISEGVLRFPLEIVDVSRPLADRADKFLTQHPKDKKALERLFTLRLAHVPTEGRPVRRRARSDECSAEEWALATELTKKEWRLLEAGETANEAYIQVAHEKLLENWPTLTNWIEDQRSFLAAKGQLELQRREWEKTEERRKPENLLMGASLNRARSWQESGRIDDLNPDDQSFVHASIAQDDKAKAFEKKRTEREKKRERLLRRGGMAAAIVLSIFGVFAGYQWWLAEDARLVAEDATQNAVVAKEDAIDARDNAKKAQQQAEDERDKAETSYQTALDAADIFLTALTDNFVDSAALPTGKMRQILTSGRAFLDDMENRIGASSELDSVRAKVLTRFASITLEDDLTVAKRQLEDARRALEKLKRGDRNKLQLEAKTATLEAEIAFKNQNYERSAQLAKQAIELMDGLPDLSETETSTFMEALLKASYSQWKQERYVKAVDYADKCLSLRQRHVEYKAESTILVEAKCIHAKALSLTRYENPNINKILALYEKEKEIVNMLVSQDPQKVAFRVLLATIINNISFLGSKKENKDWKLSLLQESRDELNQARQIAPWSFKILHMLSHVNYWIGRTLEDLDRRKDAHIKYVEAVDIYQEMISKDPTNIDWRDRFEDVLSRLRRNAISLGKKNLSSEQKDRLVRFNRIHIELLENPTESEKVDDYAKWELFEAKFRQLVFLEWNNENFAAIEAYDRYIEETRFAIGVKAEEGRPRYFASVANWNYPQCKDFAAIEIPIERKISLCERSIQVREDYLKKEDHWFVKRALTTDQRTLGELKLKFGDRVEALANMQRAANNYDEEAVKTLLNWYDTGDGPVKRDEAKATELREFLASHSFGFKRFTVPMISWNGQDALPQPFYVANPRKNLENPIDKEIHRLEEIEGFVIPQDVKRSFKKLFAIAEENNVSFKDLVVYALEPADEKPKDQNELQQTMFVALSENKISKVIETTNPIIQNDAARGMLKAVLVELAKPPEKDPLTNPKGIRFIETRWFDILYADGGARLAELAADAILNQETSLPVRTTWLYRRGLAKGYTGDFAGAIEDLSTVVSTYPNWANGINLLAYSYLEAGSEFDRALALAKRAAQIAPKDVHIKDTLGFAYIKNNQLDDGITVLRAVVADRSDLPDPWAHLAEGYRRDGQYDKAREAIAEARKNARDKQLIAYIDKQAELIESNEADSATLR